MQWIKKEKIIGHAGGGVGAASCLVIKKSKVSSMLSEQNVNQQHVMCQPCPSPVYDSQPTGTEREKIKLQIHPDILLMTLISEGHF